MVAQNTEGVCAIHCEVERRHDEKFSEQTQTNRDLFSKINSINTKVNWVLGAVTVAWPLVLVIIHLLSRGAN